MGCTSHAAGRGAPLTRHAMCRYRSDVQHVMWLLGTRHLDEEAVRMLIEVGGHAGRERQGGGYKGACM